MIRRRALAVAIALAAVAPPAHAMQITWHDQSGDANFTGRDEVSVSFKAFDVVGARVEPADGGMVVQVDLFGAPSELPGATVWFLARQGGCTVLAQWVRTLDAVAMDSRAVTSCVGQRPLVTGVIGSVREHSVEMWISDDALPGTARGVTLHGIAVGTTFADPATGIAQIEASIDVACYHGVYVPRVVRGRTGDDGHELPSLCTVSYLGP